MKQYIYQVLSNGLFILILSVLFLFAFFHWEGMELAAQISFWLACALFLPLFLFCILILFSEKRKCGKDKTETLVFPSNGQCRTFLLPKKYYSSLHQGCLILPASIFLFFFFYRYLRPGLLKNDMFFLGVGGILMSVFYMLLMFLHGYTHYTISPKGLSVYTYGKLTEYYPLNTFLRVLIKKTGHLEPGKLILTCHLVFRGTNGTDRVVEIPFSQEEYILLVADINSLIEHGRLSDSIPESTPDSFEKKEVSNE